MNRIKKNKKTSIFDTMEVEHLETFEKLNHFYEILRKLRYEGKANRGKNISEIRKLVSYFQKEITGHMRNEEKHLFPFLEKHIPRFEAMIFMLVMEHKDIRECLNLLDKSLTKAILGISPNSDSLVDALFEKGTYFVCLLRSHMWVENHNLYRLIEKELRPDEKESLLSYA